MKQLKKFNIDKATSEEMTPDETNMFLLGNNDGFIIQKTFERAHHATLPQLKDRYFQTLRNG